MVNQKNLNELSILTNSANKSTIDITNGGERMDINLQLDDQYFFKNKVLIIDDLEMMKSLKLKMD